ncbi:uncharacterized protein LOC103960949 isoform X2 [Pyrus x bretschneideri]|uniref:uncharacterized protein LOC103960949 isoform X2 n=1 Tax=Pyrus x bretschneideri TaxID=225117 RepID=UPI00202E4E95|nr:uncharacterized protein LOC103960949 isoform X2 [Pyrus x bretschneideri]
MLTTNYSRHNLCHPFALVQALATISFSSSLIAYNSRLLSLDVLLLFQSRFPPNLRVCTPLLLGMASETGRPLPKFGEWDVNNPASAEGFTMIFTRARDQKMTNGPADNGTPAPSSTKSINNQYPQEKKWFCCL